MKAAFLNAWPIKRNIPITLCYLLTFFLILSIMFLVSVPPVSKDALTHHLAVPKLYLNNGGIHEIPFMVYSYYPMNLDLLYIIPLYFGNDIVPKFIHFCFGILTAWIIYFYLKHRVGHLSAVGGALFFLSIPIVVKLCSSVYVDLGLIFFTTASLLLLIQWAQNIEKLNFLILSAVCCGLSMGTKYNGLVSFIILMAFVPIIYTRRAKMGKAGGVKAVGHAMLYAIIGLVVFSPWMIRNYTWTNNPIFPLYDGWFNTGSEVTRSILNVFTTRQLIYHESWWEMALLPVRIFFQGLDGNPQYFDGKLNLFLLILPLFVFFQGKRDPNFIRFEKKILIAFVVIFFSFSFFSTSLRIRYILPIIAPLAIISVYGAKNIIDRIKMIGNQKRRKLFTVLFSGILSFAFLINANYIYSQLKIVKPFEYLSGNISRDQYIEKYRHEYPAMQYINQNLPDNAKVLFFYIGNRGYYCDREYIFDMVNYKSMLYQTVKNSDNPKTTHRQLLQKRITHFLIREDIFNRWVLEDFSQKEKNILKGFFSQYVTKFYEKNGYSVFGLSMLK